jgi:hypothetical protein
MLFLSGSHPLNAIRFVSLWMDIVQTCSVIFGFNLHAAFHKLSSVLDNKYKLGHQQIPELTVAEFF